jgi:glycosyltransferase involved in cell wall biosynthesis
MKTKITHLTSAHPRYDTRIFIKECCSLVKVEDYEVSLIVADGLGDEVRDAVSIYDVGKLEGRMNRMTKTTGQVLQKAIEIDSDVYHLHDPELIPIGLKLKKMGKKVIFDAHEDLPKQILAKHYLNKYVKKFLSSFVSKAEISALRKFDHVVTATPTIRDKFQRENINALDVNNYPLLDELIDICPILEEKTLCYIGLLYETRGIREIIEAIADLDVTLIVAGKFFDTDFEREIRKLPGWKKVDFRGFVDRDGIKEILTQSVAGLVTLHPTPSYIEAYPVKMFEYMSAGLAVIASDFPLYRTFVIDNDCGICVDPLNTEAITKAIESVTKDLILAKKLGQEGRYAIKEKYNWEKEEKKLFEGYENVLS